MFGYTTSEEFSKTSEDISNDDEVSLVRLTKLFEEFEQVLLACVYEIPTYISFEIILQQNELDQKSKEHKKDRISTEFKSQDFTSSTVELNYPQRYFKIRHINKGSTDNIVQKFVADINEFDFFSIPSSFGPFNLMFYQRLSIYLTVYGQNSSDIGLELKLKKKILDLHFKTNSRAWNKIQPIIDCKMYPTNSNSRQKAVVFNLPTGTGKTVTALCAAGDIS